MDNTALSMAVMASIQQEQGKPTPDNTLSAETAVMDLDVNG